MTTTDTSNEDEGTSSRGDDEGGCRDMASDASDDAVDVADLHSLWVRWTDVRPERARTSLGELPIPIVDVHLHRYCDLLPTGRPNADIDVEFRYVRGGARTTLRFTPVFVILVSTLLVVYAEVVDGIVGISRLLPSVSSWILGALGGGGALWVLIIYLIGRVGLIDWREFLKAIVVWGLLVSLLAGSLYSVYLVLSVTDPSEVNDHIVFVSGYLSMLLLGGLGVYDGALRTETMFDCLADGKGSIVNDEGSYNEKGDGAYTCWKKELQKKLDDKVLGLPTSHVFSLLFITQFVVIWLRMGPQNLGSDLLLVINVVADFVLVIVAFRFLILIKYIHMLMTDQYAPDGENEVRILTYQPFHYDRRGGFQDFGRFATRVNLLLLVGGLYTVYRLYVQGLRSIPAAGILHFDTHVQLLLWAGNFVLPILAYAVAAGAWVYYSFWAIHRKMVSDKQMLSANHQGVRGGDEPLPTVGDSFEDFEDGVDWYYLKTAPEWPINSRYIASIVSANVVPLLLPLLRFV
ncbi:MAG: hypothetical protein ABEH78_03345 [Haloferacaceae archaeon]